ncbi:hypothetical protein ABZP36_005754 [Zizania latifolia]
MSAREGGGGVRGRGGGGDHGAAHRGRGSGGGRGQGQGRSGGAELGGERGRGGQFHARQPGGRGGLATEGHDEHPRGTGSAPVAGEAAPALQPVEDVLRRVSLAEAGEGASSSSTAASAGVDESQVVAASGALPPTSSKALVFPARPGFGTAGRRCRVRANHFVVQLADKTIYHYDSLRPTQMGLSLNIDISATAFYKAQPVMDFALEYLNIRDASRRLYDQDRLKLRKALKGIRVVATHRRDMSIRYKINGLTSAPLNELMFDQNGTRVSVVQYFKCQYNYSLKYVNWPCLQAGSDSRPTYLPMEVCSILEGQRYSRKLNERQVTGILKLACERPALRENSILEITSRNNYVNDYHAKEFGIKVTNQLALVDARVLPAPRLKYHDSGREKVCNPSVGQWNMTNKRMLNGGSIKYWACLTFASRLHLDEIRVFCNNLVGVCNNIGMQINGRPCVDIGQARQDNLDAALRTMHRQSAEMLARQGVTGQQLELLIIVLPEANASIFYGRIKRLCETELGVMSQCCLPKNVQKAGQQYLQNLALKINVKVGGRNTALEDALHRRIPLLTDLPTMIFGADVTHPPSGEDASPSIAAVVASMDWPEVSKYKCLVSSQSHREEIIADLFTEVKDSQKGLVYGGMIRELLVSFYRANGCRKPARIIFYRDGVSEGQFSQVLLYEMDAIRKACASIEEGYLPPVTFVVVQKRHHTRLFPEDHRARDLMDRSGNILPGTVVDTQICHPSEFDFYLCSHSGIQFLQRIMHTWRLSERVTTWRTATLTRDRLLQAALGCMIVLSQ